MNLPVIADPVIKPMAGTELNLLSPDQRLKRSGGYEMLWVKAGNGRFLVNSLDILIQPGMLYFISPAQEYRFYEGSCPLQGYFMYFPSSFMDTLVSSGEDFEWLSGCKGLFSEAVPESRQVQLELEIILRKMMQEMRDQSITRLAMIKGLLNIFLLYFSGPGVNEVADKTLYRESRIYRQFRLLLRSNYTSKKMVSQYARDLHLTSNYLNRSVKSVSGNSVSHHIQQKLISEAKRKALNGDLSLKEVASALGFESLAHFSKFFKNKSGTNFTDFKKDWSALTFHS